MLMQIRVVIEVPAVDEEKRQVAIEKILDTVWEQFPDLKVNKMHSPVTVTIKDMEEQVL